MHAVSEGQLGSNYKGQVGYQRINTGNELGVIIKVVESVALNMATTLESPTSKDRGASLP